MVKISRNKRTKAEQNLTLLTKVIQIISLGWLIFFLYTNIGPGSETTSTSTITNNNSNVNLSSASNDKNVGLNTAGVGGGGGVRGGVAEKTIIQVAESTPQKTDESESKPKKASSGEKINPSKPLRETNQQIISSAPMVDITYVDVTEGHQTDPHRGATDENGTFGYVHDEKALRKNSPPFQVTKEEVHCDNHDPNYKMLTEKVVVDLTSHEAREREAEQDGGKPRAKIFCMVYTIEKNHDKIPIIRETWGKKCDGFIVASDKTDKDLGTVNIPHEGPEEYHNIWQKVRSMWSYVYDNYYEEYDWFHIGGDDLYLIVENMRLYLESEEVQLAANGGQFLPNGSETEQLPLFLGRRFAEQGNYQRIFNSGGSGYSLNKAALKSLVVTAFPTCMPHLKTFAEDVMVAQCLRNKIKVYPFDTKDDNGGERYMPFQVRYEMFSSWLLFALQY